MKIFLMRHGHAAANRYEAERPLSRQGEQQAARAGEFLVKIGEVPDIIIHSPLNRSKMTASGVAAASGGKSILERRDGLEPEDDASSFLSKILPEFRAAGRKVMLVGHDPFISNFAKLLLTNSMAGLSLDFSRGTLLGAETIGPEADRMIWRLRFYLTAEDLEKLIWVP
jgi:phosphohistidine phosphatase